MASPKSAFALFSTVIFVLLILGGGGCDSRISEPTEDEPLLPETGQHPLPQLAAQDYKIGIDVGDNLLTGSPNEGNNKPVINWKRIKP